MSMDTQYCGGCGLLHDPEDGDCDGCRLVKEKKELEIKISVEMPGLKEGALVDRKIIKYQQEQIEKLKTELEKEKKCVNDFMEQDHLMVGEHVLDDVLPVEFKNGRQRQKERNNEQGN